MRNVLKIGGYMDRLTHKSNESDMVWFVDHENNDSFIELNEMNAHHSRLAIQKLEKYEDAEEQGLIFRLPCKVGDIVYVIDGKKIYILKVKNDIALISGELCIFVENPRYADYISYRNLGDTVFLKKEEAEQKIKELTN